LREPLFDAIAAREILQLFQLQGIARIRRIEPAHAGLACQHAIERGTRVFDPRILIGLAGRAARRTRVRETREVLLHLRLHLTPLREQRRDVALELARLLLLLVERALQDGRLVIDERLSLDASARQIFFVAVERGFDLRGQLLALGVELVDLARDELRGESGPGCDPLCIPRGCYSMFFEILAALPEIVAVPAGCAVMMEKTGKHSP